MGVFTRGRYTVDTEMFLIFNSGSAERSHVSKAVFDAW
jgi:hypothetical protein